MTTAFDALQRDKDRLSLEFTELVRKGSEDNALNVENTTRLSQQCDRLTAENARLLLELDELGKARESVQTRNKVNIASRHQMKDHFFVTRFT